MTPSFFMTHLATGQRPKWSHDRVQAPELDGYDPIPGVFEVPCSVQPADAKSSYFWGQWGIQVTHELYFETVLSLQQGDRLVVKHPERGLAYQETLLVTGFFDECYQGRLFVVGATKVES